MTVTGTTLGSVHYFSPEQARGDEVTGASDVYSLGHRAVRDADRPPAVRGRLRGRGRAQAPDRGPATARVASCRLPAGLVRDRHARPGARAGGSLPRRRLVCRGAPHLAARTRRPQPPGRRSGRRGRGRRRARCRRPASRPSTSRRRSRRPSGPRSATTAGRTPDRRSDARPAVVDLAAAGPGDRCCWALIGFLGAQVFGGLWPGRHARRPRRADHPAPTTRASRSPPYAPISTGSGSGSPARSARSPTTFARNAVISTEPAAGSQVSEGDTITVVISTGRRDGSGAAPDRPDPQRGDRHAERGAVSQLGGVTQEFRGPGAAGTVIRTDPGAGTAVERNSQVNIVLSGSGADAVADATPRRRPTHAATDPATPTPTPTPAATP